VTDHDRSRRALLRGAGALAAGSLLAGCLSGDDAAPAGDQPTTGTTTATSETTTPAADGGGVGTELVASGFANPLGVEFAPGDPDTTYVVDQAGVAYAVTDGGTGTPFLDVRDRMVALSGYEERGLLGLAFHPDYQSNGRVFARYSAPATDDTPSGFSHTFVLAEYDATSGSADPDSERRLLELPQPQANHNAGSVCFGPDGHLYVGTGDGGGANDTGRGHAKDWYDGNAGGNGQDVTENLLGSILRLDVDAAGPDRAYGIPGDNPLVGEPGFDEHYAWGFRNPWRLSFTDGDLYAADVGQNRFEEVDIVDAGGNYGWNVREATHCFDTDDPGSPPDECPGETPDGEPLHSPIIEYPHSGDPVSGISVIGGYRYTGSAVPAFENAYVFGDYRSNGRLFLAEPPANDGLWPTRAIDVGGGDSPPGNFLLAFGRDHDDELYTATTESGTPTGDSGTVHRLTSDD
jgi:glucose/arabinose dehydrogenase